MPPTAVPVGLATKTGLSTAILAFLSAIANIAAGGPPAETITTMSGGFVLVATVLVGRYAQAVHLPHFAQVIAQVVDKVLERKLKDALPHAAAAPPLAPSHPAVAVPAPPPPITPTVKDKIAEAAAEAKKRLGH